MAARKHGLLDGVSLIAPGLVAAVRPPFVTRLRVLLASRFRPTKPFDIPLNDPELFTADVRWQQFVREDPQGLHLATARFLFESFRFDIYLKRVASRVHTPVLLQLAEHDRILDNPATRGYLSRLTAAKSIDVIDCAGAHHTLEFEPEGHPSTRDLICWMKRKTPA
jgi:alpha-beta hydrolase superfamily lysophospholipase